MGRPKKAVKRVSLKDRLFSKLKSMFVKRVK